MNIARSSAAVIGAYTLTAALAQGQAILSFQDIKNFRQVGPEDTVFEGGAWNLSLRDGVVFVLPCAGNAGFIFEAPNIFCPSGTTGLITQGDFDGDGLRDIGLYYSVNQPIPAIQVEPFQSNLISLEAAPPSDLPRPLGGFSWEDSSIVVFFDLVNDPVNGVGYELTGYDSSRPYNNAELERQRDEIVPGTYTFSFPALGTKPETPRRFIMNAFHRPMAEAFPGPGGRSVESGGIQVGNDFRLLDDDRWRDGEMEIDPRLVFDFRWEGINAQTFIAGDRMFFSVRDINTNEILFPPYPDDRRFPQLIGSSTLGIPTGYELGPDFFAPGLKLEIELQFTRGNRSGNTIDESTRFFSWTVSTIDSYAGFVGDNFPLASDESLLLPGADYDGDGFTNLEEFGLQTSPTDPASVPVIQVELDEFTNQCFLEVPKRPAAGGSIDYLIQYSFDTVSWTTITRQDPNWFIVDDNDDFVSVLSKRPFGVVPCFVRVGIQENF
jgi:hypothetical protein